MQQNILAHIPHLRAFARLLCRDHVLADDLVQDTVERALIKQQQFREGTNLKAWLTIILRNRYFNERRRIKRRSEVGIEAAGDSMVMMGNQDITLEVRDFGRAFQRLPSPHREALLLVGASGFSYQEAAAIADCAVGTMKSRVSRARQELEQDKWRSTASRERGISAVAI